MKDLKGLGKTIRILTKLSQNTLPHTTGRVKSKLILGRIIRICPGGHHAWYESDIGPVRKPIQ